MDLMKGIIINVRSGKNRKPSPNRLISMLENLLSQAGVDEKKRVLTEKYGMIMTTELEGRIQTMCNLSENIKELGIEEGIEKGIEKGIEEGEKSGDLRRLVSLICKKVKKNKTLGEVAEDLEEEISAIEPLYRAAEKFAPEYDPDEVFEQVKSV